MGQTQDAGLCFVYPDTGGADGRLPGTPERRSMKKDVLPDGQAGIPALLAEARNGSEEAAAALLEQYQPMIVSLTGKYTGELPEELRRDLHQEANIAFCHAVERFDPDKGVGFGQYAKVCVRNRIVGYLRAWRKEPVAEALPLDDPEKFFPAGDSDPARDLMEQETYLALCGRIRGALSPYENRVWTLFISGLTAREIADRLRENQKSVENAVSRIRKKLRSALLPH